MSRLLGAVVLCAALASCTSGTPQATTAPTSSSVTTTSPRIDTPRNLAGLDPCQLVVENDFKERGFGKLTTAPRPYQEIPGTCASTFGSDKPNDLVVVVGVIDQAYEAEKTKNPGGHEGLIDGHNVYFHCGSAQGGIACAAWAAVGDGKTLTLGLNQLGATESRLLLATQGVITTVLGRLPKAS